MLVIGDVTGRGARAASITAVARYTLRTAAVLTDDPLVALATLNRALLARGDAALCSVAAWRSAEDPTQPVRLAVAGHPPPLLVDGEAVSEVAAADPVLGAFADAEWDLGAQRGRARPAARRRHRRDHRGAGAGWPLRRGAAARSSSAARPTRRWPCSGWRGPLHVVHRGEPRGRRRDPRRLRPAPRPTSMRRRSTAALGAAMADRCASSSSASSTPSTAATRPASSSSATRRWSSSRSSPPKPSAATPRTSGRRACADYLADVAQIWEELLITPSEVEREARSAAGPGPRLRAQPRARHPRHARSAWIWEVRDGRFVRGEVFPTRSRRATRFELVAA